MDEVAFGRYRLVELIGEGGMGQVYKAHDTAIGRDVAIKVLPPEMAKLPGYQERFRREAQVAARLTEPHIIPIHDTGEIEGRLYLVMPVIDGIDVHTLLAREGPMAPQQAVWVVQQLAAALNAAHRNGLVHRDIKPSNALMTPEGHVYLIDFGVAHDAEATRLTQTGSMVGTFRYMAPERFATGTSDVRVDVYALACVLHECLTGGSPFPGTSMEQQIAAHLTAAPPRPSVANPRIPRGFDEVIARGMAKKPEERYQTAGELAAAAHNALSGAPRPPGPLPPQPPPPGPWPPRPPGPPGPTDPTLAAKTVRQPVPLLGQVPDTSVISAGRFASVLVGAVLVSLAIAGLLGPWRGATWTFAYNWFTSALMWLFTLSVIPGIVLLTRGRGRQRIDRTITGCALVALGVGTVLYRTGILYTFTKPEWVAIPTVIGLALLLIPAFPRPTRALTRGLAICGGGILALVFFDMFLRPLGYVYVASMSLVIGAAVGIVLTLAGAITTRLAARSPQGAAAPEVSVGTLISVLIGVALLGVAAAVLLLRGGQSAWTLDATYYSGYRSHIYYGSLAALNWVAMLAVIPGIALLKLGQGRRHPDQTIAGVALVSLPLGTILALLMRPLGMSTVEIIGYFFAFAALPLIVVPVSQRPSLALARGCLICGAGCLVLTLLFYAIDQSLGYVTVAALIGAILVLAGSIARRRARRTGLGGPQGQMPTMAAG